MRRIGRRGEARMPAALMNAEEIAKLLHEVFPQGFYPGCGLAIERVDYGSARVRRLFQESYIRPGGTISGATMMELLISRCTSRVFLPLALSRSLSRQISASISSASRGKPTWLRMPAC